MWPGTRVHRRALHGAAVRRHQPRGRQARRRKRSYGTFGGLIALAGWISLHGLVALIGAELNAALDRRRHERRPGRVDEATAAFNARRPLSTRLTVDRPPLRVRHVAARRRALADPRAVRRRRRRRRLRRRSRVRHRSRLSGGDRSAATARSAAARTGSAPTRSTRRSTRSTPRRASVPGGYRAGRRHRPAGRRRWAYEYGDGLELTPIASGDWLDR